MVREQKEPTLHLLVYSCLVNHRRHVWRRGNSSQCITSLDLVLQLGK
jgi:hypothetical protein